MPVRNCLMKPDSSAVSPQELIALRRELHRFPESAWTEYRTTCRIIQELQKLGLEVAFGHAIHCREAMLGLPEGDAAALCRAEDEGCDPDLLAQMAGGYTGCVAVIRGAQPGKTVAVRVDIDCNILTEDNDPHHRPAGEGFASTHEGRMHGCGHDGHAAIGLGLARALTQRRDTLCGTVKLIFQPAEEGLGGAASLTAAGVLDGVDILLGNHIGLRLAPVGTVAASAHDFLASTKLDVTFHGKAAHAGQCPEVGRNALAAGAAAVTNLLAIARSGQGASRINIGTFVSVAGRNVIPDRAKLSLETRGATGEINDYMESAALRVCAAAADMYGCTAQHTVIGRAGTAACDEALVSRVSRMLGQVQGVERAVPSFSFQASEDITTMMGYVQAHGGQATELIWGADIAAPHHNCRFDFDEAVLPLAVRALAALVPALTDPMGVDLRADKR